MNVAAPRVLTQEYRSSPSGASTFSREYLIGSVKEEWKPVSLALKAEEEEIDLKEEEQAPDDWP